MTLNDLKDRLPQMSDEQRELVALQLRISQMLLEFEEDMRAMRRRFATGEMITDATFMKAGEMIAEVQGK